jgi:hypothetical protein
MTGNILKRQQGKHTQAARRQMPMARKGKTHEKQILLGSAGLPEYLVEQTTTVGKDGNYHITFANDGRSCRVDIDSDRGRLASCRGRYYANLRHALLALLAKTPK